ncbi:MAG TPA: hypothetical protein VJT81_06455 [Burkholderiales bacterium]|nr:hypothetical protein [Burkholderiales bacterium]
MNPKTFARTIDELNRSGARYNTLHGHFERFCAQAKRLAEDSDSPLRGLLANMDGDALLVQFLDRRIRISMRYDRKTLKGVLHAEDESAVRPGLAPETFERVPFDGAGETALSGGEHGDNLNLSLPADCLTLLVRLVDAALGRDPWDVARDPGPLK